MSHFHFVLKSFHVSFFCLADFARDTVHEQIGESESGMKVDKMLLCILTAVN